MGTGDGIDPTSFVGTRLEGGWTIRSLLEQASAHTGGNFSIPFTVEHDGGELGFLKMLDFRRGLRHPDPAAALNSLTQSFLYERDLLYTCRDRKMSKVVRPLAHGTVRPPGSEIPWQYLIFERADGDARDQIAALSEIDDAWALRALHHMAIGLHQLHRAQIAHQDLKPSNVLVFRDDFKIGDLGRASTLQTGAVHDANHCAGDPSYSPPEALYGAVPLDDWHMRRIGCDLYLLGSLAVSFYLNIGLTAALLARLNEDHHPRNWGDSYSALLPHLRSSFSDVLLEIRRRAPLTIGEELSLVISQLSDPDPTRRGHPQERPNGNRYSLERFISIFDRLATSVEIRFRR